MIVEDIDTTSPVTVVASQHDGDKPGVGPCGMACRGVNVKTMAVVLSIFLSACGVPQEEGSIEVFFCPQDDCENILISFIREDTICAFYDLNLKNLTDHLVRMDAKVLLFEDYFEDYGNNFYEVRSRALMHNKFCITNDSVITGSLNPTNNGAYKNDNNLVIIESETIAQNYRDEFLELQTRQEKSVKNSVVELFVNNRSVLVENYFCPEDECEKEVLEELNRASKSIYFMTFSFTSDPIGRALVRKYEQGLDVQGVFEKRQQNKYSEHHRFEEKGVPYFWDQNPNTMHHKVFVIDNKTVITGSMNPSRNGNERNDENVLIIHDEQIAQKYSIEYHKPIS